MVEQTKLPVRRAMSDDFEVVAGPDTYHPHAGEWVEFSGDASVEDLMRFMSVMGMAGMTPATLQSQPPEEIARISKEVRDALQQSIDELSERIVAWSWTDNDRKAYPSPPTAAELLSLSQDELAYLVTMARGQVRTESGNSNGSRASMPSSTKRKARSRR